MRRLKTAMSIALLIALVVPLSAGAQAPNPGEEVVQALLGRIEVAANENGVPPSDILEARIRINVSDGSDPIEVTVEEAIVRIAGKSIIDPTFNGILGTPQANAGNILHILFALKVEVFTALGFPPESALPPAPVLAHYDVVESGLTPSTPVAAVPNPLLLTGNPLPPEIELPSSLDEPILLLHPGGRLKSVQASDYLQGGANTATGVHSAGTTVIGSNLDTEARMTADGDPWPIWLPVLTGDLARPDQQIDFLGFAIVAQGQTCTLTRLSSNPVSPLFNRIAARTCLAIGTLIGEGTSLFDGAPVNLREATSAAALWDPVPAPISDVVSAVDDALAQVGQAVADVQEMVPPLPSAEVPQLPAAQSTQSGSSARPRLLRR